ncbi:MAG TPA: SpoIIE family protein phosphatase [Pseudonocardiaceae bacterium]|nr:SpoIIE family protein phosphatase [Pseudonocardiaceae bacterium]
MAVQRPGDPEIERLSRVVARQQGDLERLRAQVEHTLVVERAKGMLIERLGCSPSEATDHLALLAERAGLTVLEVAAELGGGPAGTVADGIGPLRLRSFEAAVTLATDGATLADAVFADVLAGVGAAAVAFWLLQPDGMLRLVGQHGLRPLDEARWRCQPPDMPTVGRRALAESHPIWLPAGLADGELAPAATRWPGGARAVLPLRYRRATLGVMEICWPGPADISPGLRTQLAGLADLCAGTLAPAGDEAQVSGLPPWATALLDTMLDTLILARPVRDEHGVVVDFAVDHMSPGAGMALGRADEVVPGGTLLQRFPMLADRGGLFERLLDVLVSGTPYRADGLVVPTLVGDRVLTPAMDVRIAPLADGVALAWRHHDRTDLPNHVLRLSRTGGWEENVVTGRTEWTAQMFDLLDAPAPITLREWRSRPEDVSVLDRFVTTLLTGARPATAEFTVATDNGSRRLRAIGEPVTDSAGSVLAVRGVLQDVTSLGHVEYALSAAQDQLTDVERLVDEQQQLAIRLQHSIIPPAPPTIDLPGVQVVVRYRPAGNQHLVGGDWYDALALPSGQVLLVVGDIMGNGIDAVTGMISMRNGLRGLAMTGARPGELLGWLNDSAFALPESGLGTVICAQYDPGSNTLRWARAGHLPPILVRDGTSELLPLSSGPMLGVMSDAEFTDTVTELRAGDMLALYTDGLVERRGEHLDYGLNRLMGTAKHVDEDIDVYADRLLGHIPPNTSDDTCLVIVQVR